MTGANDTGVVAAPVSGRRGRTRRLRGLAGTGLLATLAAMAATTGVAALARAAGVDFQIPEGGEAIPLPGFAVVTGLFSVVGVAIALALLRWSARATERFGWTAVSLTAISLIPPLLVGADAAISATLIGLHLVAATVMIPVLVRSLGGRTDRPSGDPAAGLPATRAGG
ncbi:DUF6069 family protein [Plantactinospora siamensis]|uniref:DUF6069 family protein n=1 Tax=Plantactinospora siamensis TaxID=555372 RepID=A0ABV6P3X3_9ACTN